MLSRGYHGRCELSLRPATAHDAQRILPLMQTAFRNPWSLQELHRHLRDEECSAGMLAFEDDPDYCGPAGYVLYNWDRRRGSWEIVNLAVQPKARRRGVASQLLMELQSPLNYKGCREHLTAIVGETNLAGQLLFRAAGFYLHQVLPDWIAGEAGYQFVYDRIALRLNNLWPAALRVQPQHRQQARGR